MALTDIADLLRQLKNQQDGTARERAAILLGKTGDAQAVEPLCRALYDDHVRFAATEVLVSFGAAAVPLLIASAHNAPYKVRIRLTEALVKIGQAAVAPLIAALADSSEDVRKTAVRALSTIGDKCAVEPLCAALTDKNRGVRWLAAKALGSFKDNRAILPLTLALKDTDLDVGKAAAEALDHFDVPSDPQAQAWYWVAKDKWLEALSLGDLALEPLCAALKDSNKKRIAEAAKTLSKLGPAALEPLCFMLSDSRAYARQAAAQALYDLADKRAVEALCSIIVEKNRKWELRMATAVALKKIGDPRAEAALARVCLELLDPFKEEWFSRDLPRISKTSL